MADPWMITAPRDAVAESVGGTTWSVTRGVTLPAEFAALVAPPIVVRTAPVRRPAVTVPR